MPKKSPKIKYAQRVGSRLARDRALEGRNGWAAVLKHYPEGSRRQLPGSQRKRRCG